MKKFLSVVLLGAMVLSAFPAQAQGVLTRMVQAGAQAAQNAKRQTELNQKALQSIPANAKTHITFSWSEPTANHGRAYLDNVCTAILCDYNEKNGLGTVQVAVNAACVKEAIKGNHGYVITTVFLGAFGFEPDPTPYIRGEQFSYETELLPATFKDILHYRKVTSAENPQQVLGTPFYMMNMPVPSDRAELQRGLRALFPNKKSFVTAERAARALSVDRNPKSYVQFDENAEY